MTKKSVAVIGAGFAGLAAATTLAHLGHEVSVYEKHDIAGGRARLFSANEFVFDMGPSWYWMPDVFENYFQRFGKSVNDYYELVRLDPSYRVVFPEAETWDIPANFEAFCNHFETHEKGSAAKLRKFLDEAAYKYEVGMNKLVYKPGQALSELFDPELFRGLLRLHVFNSISDHIRKFFQDKRIIQLLEFPVLFLGATPSETPALYSLMNYADIKLGTWYPKGGMHKIVEGMVQLARELGVQFHFNSEIKGFQIKNKTITGMTVGNEEKNDFDLVVAGADYHHVEQELLPAAFRMYSENYWETRKMAPSSLIFYLGSNKKVPRLLHHNLFFDRDFSRHAQEIYHEPNWPEEPLFYVCCPSKTDPTVAPEDAENLFILIPVAPGLNDSEKVREHLFEHVMQRLEKYCNMQIRNHIVYKKSYAHRDFIEDYHAFKGNAYGLANTLRQTANLKPSIVNKKLKNLYYTGQLTVPGPGVPPSLVSGQVVAEYINTQV